MKVAIVHDWLIHMRGGEKVLECFAELYPEATIYTLFYNREKLSPSLKNMKIKASFLQYLPGIRTYYRWLLPILPWVIESMKIKDAEIVLSSSHCVSKGIRFPKESIHVCYCHTPMRYIWGFEDIYFKRTPKLLKPLLNLILDYLRKWDLKSSQNVHSFIANAKNVQARIQKFYKRDSIVIYPPLDDEFYYPVGGEKNYYLVVSAFVPYKKVDLVIEAFNGLEQSLYIVGSGPLDNHYRAMKKSDKITFLGGISNRELRKVYSGAKALIFPTDEDFGIVPLEAQACGTPIIAFGAGGALESVKEGIFFKEQSAEAIRKAVIEFDQQIVDSASIPQKVKSFGRRNFKSQISQLIEGLFSQIKKTKKNKENHVNA